MKKVLFSLLTASVLLMSSCSKDLEKVLVGTWNVDKSSFSIVEIPLFSEMTENDGTIEFKSDGTGIAIDRDGDKDTFTWSSTDDKVTIKFTGDDSITFTVLTNEKKKQVWESTFSEIDEELGTLTYKLKLELSKK